MKTTIELAREAAGDEWYLFREFMPEIHRLVELVRADERARMAEQPAQLAWTDKMTIDVPDQELYKAQPAPAQHKPVALKWQQAPVKTQWGDDMVVASVAIDKDHTVDLYCERDQTPKVDAMFAQRTWVGLTDEEIEKEWVKMCGPQSWARHKVYGRAIEAKLKEKNT